MNLYFVNLLLFGFQPQHDLCHLLEGLNEYKGILSTFPDILLVYRVCILNIPLYLVYYSMLEIKDHKYME